MKNQLRSLLLLCTFVSFSVSSFAFSYNITFSGSGASTTVYSVVKNQTKSTEVKLPARFLLKLIYAGIVTDDINVVADFALIYSKPVKTGLYIRSDALYTQQDPLVKFLPNYTTGENINVSTLASGVYLVRISSRMERYMRGSL